MQTTSPLILSLSNTSLDLMSKNNTFFPRPCMALTSIGLMSNELGTSDVSEVGERFGDAGVDVRLEFIGGMGVLAGRSIGRTGNLLEGVMGGIDDRGEIGVGRTEGTVPGKLTGTAGNLLLSSSSHSCKGGNAFSNSGDGARMREGMEGRGEGSGNRGELGSDELGEGGPKDDNDTKACGEDRAERDGEGRAGGDEGVGDGNAEDEERDAGFGGAGGGARLAEP